ncbi:MAG: septation protein A [Coxiella sp. RIFCSPHIGHO2_12_FULL_42_15]|nr:MAG: septation protein A [Coxiella sp. RIFCSPHIGHO2_12_FULL_42_15]
MKFLFDYFPIIIFFLSYKFWNIFVATALTMAASILQVAIYWLMHRRFEKFHIITMIFILILGTFTLAFHNAIFIKWKPSIVYWIFSIVLLGSQYIGSKSLIHRMLDEKISLPLKIWQRINLSWAVFFFLLGLLNIYVVYHYDTNTWVNFKLFGTLILMVLFIFIQALYISKHMQQAR